MTDLDIRFGAATMRGEAEGEGDLGMELVAWVLRNRVARPGWPNTVVGVCLDDLDISFWNGDSKRRAEVLTDESEAHHKAAAIFLRVWYADREDDPTDGADHYYNPSLASPGWARGMLVTIEYKQHRFLDSRRTPEASP